MPSVNSIGADKLARLIGTPGSPTLIDIRLIDDRHLIPGAMRRDPTSPAS